MSRASELSRNPGARRPRDVSRVIWWLDGPGDPDRKTIGGKAAGLAATHRAGAPVPPGFAVTTAAYVDFNDVHDIPRRIEQMLQGVRLTEQAELERATESIRALIVSHEMSEEIASAIAAAYESMGDGASVAVRSSGVAEDMQDASFAGLYETYLNVVGGEAVVKAVQACWASSWTARCVSYRRERNIPHDQALVAVVVQKMVDADVAGVLFTANPLNGRTDEMVVNANWGLGESVASGIASPDEFLIDRGTLGIKARALGSKEIEVVRDPVTGATIKRQVEFERQRALTLDDRQLAALAAMGRKLEALSDGMPQDIEWAISGEQLYALQCRDITGVDFLWEEDLDCWQRPPENDAITWTNSWAQQFWSGAVTPLFYTLRAREMRDCDDRTFATWGFDELAKMRRYKYYKGSVYYSCDADRIYFSRVLPPALRKYQLGNLPPSWRPETAAADSGLLSIAGIHMRVRMLTQDQGPLRSIASLYRLIDENKDRLKRPSAEELRDYSDDDLRRHIDSVMKLGIDFFVIVRPAFHLYSATAFGVLREMLVHWAGDEDIDAAFQELVSGLPKRTAMLQEQVDLWTLAEILRASPVLLDLLGRHEGPDFFHALGASEEGRDFLSKYAAFVADHGHRGHQDRDIWFPRRSEDPWIDYRSLKTLAMAPKDARSPEENEARLSTRRVARTEAVLAKIRSRPFGEFGAELFKLVLEYVHRFLVLRDDERPFFDRVTMAKRVAFLEVGRRLHERGLIEKPDDFYFLGQDEIYQLMAAGAVGRRTRTKIANRRRAFEAFMSREYEPPMYIRAGVPVSDGDAAPDDSGGVMSGVGISRGVVTGRARIVRDLRQIGAVQPGDILVCNSTDPGWTPVFSIVAGLVLEAGGMLSHGACLSREYGLPAVTLPRAIRRIPEGATIKVDGILGKVTIIHDADRQ
ncbi:MAG TPA: PEP/pyruvate-binding domain-containing protein [Rhodoblastus sp.]|nr:PEP/pyruvate-binding domain-containing protein [Rhodoblastus sp.]